MIGSFDVFFFLEISIFLLKKWVFLVKFTVSQVEQAANLTSEGYELVGWFHSHPTFEANPSRTDVATQADMQLQFSMESDRPFIGFILNCQDMHYK